MQAEPNIHPGVVHRLRALDVGKRNVSGIVREHDRRALRFEQIAQLKRDQEVDLAFRHARLYAGAPGALPLLGAVYTWGDLFKPGIRRFLLAWVDADRAPGKPPCGMLLRGLRLRKREQAALKRIPIRGEGDGAERAVLPHAKEALQANDRFARRAVEQAGNFPFIEAERAQLRLQRYHIVAKIARRKDLLRGDFRHGGRGERSAAQGKRRKNAAERGEPLQQRTHFK